jgi:hypothetical protein
MAPVTQFTPVVSQLVLPNSKALLVSVIVPPSDRITLPPLPGLSPTEKTPPKTQAPESPHGKATTVPPSDPDDPDDVPVGDEVPLEDEEDVPLPSADPDDVPESDVPPSSMTASCKFPSTRLQATRAPTPEQTANAKIPRRVALDICLTIVPRGKPRL